MGGIRKRHNSIDDELTNEKKKNCEKRRGYLRAGEWIIAAYFLVVSFSLDVKGFLSWCGNLMCSGSNCHEKSINIVDSKASALCRQPMTAPQCAQSL